MTQISAHRETWTEMILIPNESAEDPDKLLIKAYLHWQSVSVIVDYPLPSQRQYFHPMAKVMDNTYHWQRDPDWQLQRFHTRACHSAIPSQCPSLAARAIMLSTHFFPPWHRFCWGSIVETEKNKGLQLVFCAVASDEEVTVGRVLLNLITLRWRCSLETARA